MALRHFLTRPGGLRAARLNNFNICPLEDFDVILVSFLTPLGSLLAFLLGPLGRPNRPKIDPSRLLKPYLIAQRAVRRAG